MFGGTRFLPTRTMVVFLLLFFGAKKKQNARGQRTYASDPNEIPNASLALEATKRIKLTM